MKFNNVFFYITIVILLQGCLVAKNYEAPDYKTNEFSRLDSVVQDTSKLADLKWNTFYKDEQLLTYIDSALQNNFDIRKAEKRIEAAHAYFKQGKASWWPSISANAQVNHQILSENSQFGSIFNGSLTQYEFSATLSWEADIWGKIRSQKRAGEAQYLESIAAQKAVQSLLIADIAKTYYQLLAADERKRVTQETIAIRTKSLNTLKALKDAGQVTQISVQQAQVQLEEAEILLADIENQIYTFESTMMLLLGAVQPEVQRNTLFSQDIDTTLTNGIAPILLSNRPDVKMAEMNYWYYFEQSNIARASMYPTLKISATGGFQSLTPGNWFNLGSLFGNFVGGIVQPIFQQRKLKTQYEVAQAQQEEILLNFYQTIFTASNEVSNILQTLETLKKQLTRRQAQEQTLQSALENAETLLREGSANYLEVLTMQENLLSIQLQLIDTKTAQLQSMTQLYRALGGGL